MIDRPPAETREEWLERRQRELTRARQNGEDYNADFLVMLNTWEAAQRFLVPEKVQKPPAIEIARLLGWMRDLRPGHPKARLVDRLTWGLMPVLSPATVP